MSNNITRCEWPKNDPLMIEYHDLEWGVPVHNDSKHFEFFVLDTFQAGLSWQIVLHKREGFRRAFADFDPAMVATFSEADESRLREDREIIRNKLKISATIHNAKLFLEIQESYGSFDKFIWQFTAFKTIKNHWKTPDQIPVKTKVSDKMSLELKKLGFKFCGSTICYAYMQASGMVNDHLTGCFRH